MCIYGRKSLLGLVKKWKVKDFICFKNSSSKNFLAEILGSMKPRRDLGKLIETGDKIESQILELGKTLACPGKTY